MNTEILLQQAFDAAKNKQYEEAYTIWIQLAENGNPFAQVNIGYMYQNGLHVSEDFDKGEVWYEKALSSNLPEIREMLKIINQSVEVEEFINSFKDYG